MLRASFHFTGTHLHEYYKEFGLPDKLNNDEFIDSLCFEWPGVDWLLGNPDHVEPYEVRIWAGANTERALVYLRDILLEKAGQVYQELERYRDLFGLSCSEFNMRTPRIDIVSVADVDPFRKHLIPQRKARVYHSDPNAIHVDANEYNYRSNEF